MEEENEISGEILAAWDRIRFCPYSARAQGLLHKIKERDLTGYCILLGLIFEVAVYQNKELPEDARGKDPEAFVVTTRPPLPAPTIAETRDFGEAWRLAVEVFDLEHLYEQHRREQVEAATGWYAVA